MNEKPKKRWGTKGQYVRTLMDKTELLRAAQYGTGTPAEELLRVGVESRKDV